jgi:hypothetical protein
LGRGARQQQLSVAPASSDEIGLISWKDTALMARIESTPNGQRVRLGELRKTDAGLDEERTLAEGEPGTLTSLELRAAGEGATVAWIERARGSDATRARVLRLDAAGEPVATAASLSPAGGSVRALRVLCDGARCRAAADVRSAAGHHLEGFAWEGDGRSAEGLVLLRHSTLAADLSALTLSDAGLFYADRRDAEGLLRRARVQWR